MQPSRVRSSKLLITRPFRTRLRRRSQRPICSTLTSHQWCSSNRIRAKYQGLSHPNSSRAIRVLLRIAKMHNLNNSKLSNFLLSTWLRIRISYWDSYHKHRWLYEASNSRLNRCRRIWVSTCSKMLATWMVIWVVGITKVIRTSNSKETKVSQVLRL